MGEDETPPLNTDLARQVQNLGIDAVEGEQQDAMGTIEALMLGTLSMARSYMDAADLADYLRFVADRVEDTDDGDEGDPPG
ncbi:MAG: hypothetical protein ACLFSJ_00555 [Halorhodospira sp.]